jgi:hypothetical protein
MYRLPLLLFINVTSTPSLPDQHFSFPDDRAATPTLNWHYEQPRARCTDQRRQSDRIGSLGCIQGLECRRFFVANQVERSVRIPICQVLFIEYWLTQLLPRFLKHSNFRGSVRALLDLMIVTNQSITGEPQASFYS